MQSVLLYNHQLNICTLKKALTAVLSTRSVTVIARLHCCYPAVFVSLDTEMLGQEKPQQNSDLLGHRNIRKRQRHEKSC